MIERLRVELRPGEGAPARVPQLRADTGSKLPDCCVLRAAENCGGKVATFDSALLKAASELKLRTPG